MEKDKLKQYFWLVQEIKKQEIRLEKVYMKKARGALTSDVVSGSSSSFPYGPTHFKISGYDEGYTPIYKQEDRLIKAIKKAEQAKTDIEDYIDTVEDARLRELLRDRFIECLKWEEIGKRNFCAPDYARALVREFISA